MWHNGAGRLAMRQPGRAGRSETSSGEKEGRRCVGLGPPRPGSSIRPGLDSERQLLIALNWVVGEVGSRSRPRGRAPGKVSVTRLVIKGPRGLSFTPSAPIGRGGGRGLGSYGRCAQQCRLLLGGPPPGISIAYQPDTHPLKGILSHKLIVQRL